MKADRDSIVRLPEFPLDSWWTIMTDTTLIIIHGPHFLYMILMKLQLQKQQKTSPTSYCNKYIRPIHKTTILKSSISTPVHSTCYTKWLASYSYGHIIPCSHTDSLTIFINPYKINSIRHLRGSDLQPHPTSPFIRQIKHNDFPLLSWK